MSGLQIPSEGFTYENHHSFYLTEVVMIQGVGYFALQFQKDLHLKKLSVHPVPVPGTCCIRAPEKMRQAGKGFACPHK